MPADVNSNPLGKYGEGATTLAALFVLGAWVIASMAGVPAAESGSLHDVAILAVGILFGGRAATNGAARIARAAHARLDAINAPPTEAVEPPS